MSDLPKTCLHCSEVLGCRYLADPHGAFIPERVITEENFRECPDWAPIGTRQKWVRDVLYGLQGDGGVRVLHQMPRIIMDDLAQQEKEEEVMPLDDNPDFTSMLRPGMTTLEREEQLRYETDAQGNIQLDEQGQKRPRAQYVISKFACDPERHIQLDHSAGMFYKLDEVIKYILDREVEQGLLVKPKRPKKEAQPAAAPAVAIQQQQKETKMPIEGRKIIRPTKNAAAPAAAPSVEEESAPPAPPAAPAKVGPVGLPRVPGKVAQPPKRPPTQAEVAQSAPAEAPAINIDLKEIIPDIQVAVGQAVQAAMEEVVNQINAKVEEQTATVIDAITIMHDLHVQTGGTFRGADGSALEEKFEAKRKILDYLPE